jgi:hypothetical protein
VLAGEIQSRGLGAVLDLVRAFADLESEDVLTVPGLAYADELGQRRVLLCGGDDLLPDAVLAAVRAEDPVARCLEALLGPRGERALGEFDALFAQPVRLLAGEEQLDSCGALSGARSPSSWPSAPARSSSGICSLVTSAVQTDSSSPLPAPPGSAWAAGAAASPPSSSEAAARIDLALRLMCPPRCCPPRVCAGRQARDAA